MTIKDWESRVEAVKRHIGEYIHREFDVNEFLLGKAAAGETREALFRLCSELLFGFLPTTSGETLYEPTGEEWQNTDYLCGMNREPAQIAFEM